MIRVPGYDFNSFPYVLLKDSKFISIIDVFARKSLPIIRSPNEAESISNHNFYCDWHDDNKDKPINLMETSSTINGFQRSI
jgi:hypothetical protein